MTEFSRRHAMAAIGAAAGAAAAPPAIAQVPPPLPPVFAGKRVPKPLGFDPAKLPGLSERMIRSHWELNYSGAVKTLNMIEARLAAAMADKDLPPVVYGGLKREQLHRTGSVILHESYFGALGGDGVAAGDVKAAIAAHWGSFDAWEAEFRRTAMALAGGSGWCVLAWSVIDGTLGSFWGSDHMHQPAGSIPLIALDMYEHAYAIDYGAVAPRYIDAFMANLDWEAVEKRWQAARRLRI
jgi:superoxide dismutase, Fe-Mn family